MEQHAALGFRAHSGWAAMVAVAGTPRRPQILERRRIELADATQRFPYHAAQQLPPARAKELVKQCESAAAALAQAAFAELVAELEAKGYLVTACGVVSGSSRPLPALPSILASHALIHTAEGEHFREALVHAADARGLTVVRVPERELPKTAASCFHTPSEDLLSRVSELGRELGAPWRVDQKVASLVGWLALAG